MNNKVSKNDFVTVVKETLNNGQKFIFVPSGSSMKPMLNGTTDSVTLVSKPNVLKKYDVVFYHRQRDNAIVLHRIVGINADGTYTLSGDNQYYFDDNISDQNIIAFLSEYTHNGKVISTNSKKFLFYSYFIVLKKKIGRMFIKIKRNIKRK